MAAQAIEIIGMSMATDPPSSLDGKSCIKVVGADMTKIAATKAMAQAGVSPRDINVLELHDCFSANEVRWDEVHIATSGLSLICLD
jgi:acetyl-CoA acetyltransferase